MMFLPDSKYKPVKVTFNFILVVLALFLFSCGGGGGGSQTSSSSSSQANQPNHFALISTPEELSLKYGNFPVNGVISVSFTKNLDAASSKGRESIGVELKDWIKVILNGTPINGKVFVGSDGASLVFVPSSFLKPGANYTVLVEPVVRSVDGDTLGASVSFSLHTANGNIAILNIPSSVKEDESFVATLKTSLKNYTVRWDMDTECSEDRIMENVDTVEYSYKTPGEHKVSVYLKDEYGRSATISGEIMVIPDSEKVLRESDNLSGVEQVSIEDVDSDTLRSAIEEVAGSSGVYVSEAEESEGYRSGINQKIKVQCVSMEPEAFRELPEIYLKELSDRGSLIGIVSLIGFPAVLSYTNNNDTYKLNIMVYDYALNIKQGDYNGYSLSNIYVPPISNTPKLYFVSVNVDKKTIESLKKILPERVEGFLPIMYVKDGKIMVALRPEKKGLGGFVSYVVGGVADAFEKALSILEDLVPSEVYSTMKRFATYISNMKSLGGISKVGGYISMVKDIKSEFLSLYNRFGSDPGGILSGYTDPDQLLSDLKSFVYTKGSPSLKTFIDGAMSRIQSEAESINVILNRFKDSLGNIWPFIENMVPDKRKSSAVYFEHSDSLNGIVIKDGSQRYELNLSTLETFSKYADAFGEKVGANFPLNYLINTIENVLNRLPSVVAGFFYDSNKREMRFLSKIGSSSSKRCSDDLESGLCFGEYLYENGMKCEIGANYSQSTGILVSFSPLEPTLPQVDGAGELYSFLRERLPSYPNLSVDIRTRYRNNYVDIQGSTHPNVSLSGGVEFAVEFDYHLLFGGRAKISLLLSAGVDPAAFMAGVSNTLEGVLKGIIKTSFHDAKNMLNSTQVSTTTIGLANGTSVTLPLIRFPSDKEFLDFVNLFLNNINNKLVQNGLSNLANSIGFSIGIGAEVGAGVGAGGTGTGGASLDGKLSSQLGLNFDLTTALQLVHFLHVSNVNTFIISPLRNFLGLMETLEGDGASSIISKEFAVQIATVYLKTFSELLNNVGVNKDYLNDLFWNIAQHTSVSLSFGWGGEGEAEEVASGDFDTSSGPSLSINGEGLLNILYPIINKDKYKTYFDHPGVYPQISFSYPVSVETESGFDEGIKVTFKGSIQADFFSATVTIKNDPFADNGIHSTGTNAVLKLPVSAMVSSDKSSVYPGDVVKVDCSFSPSDASVEWYVEGLRVSSTGELKADNGDIVAKVVEFDNNHMKLTDLHGNVGVVCIVSKDGKKAFDSVQIYTTNTISGIPGLSIDNGSVVRNSINIIPVNDIAGYAVTYKIQISDSPSFNKILYSVDVGSEEFEVPDNLMPGRPYYVRVSATDGYFTTPFSPVKMFYPMSKIVLLDPEDNCSVYVGDRVSFSAEIKNEGGDDVLSGCNAYVEISTDSEFNHIVKVCNYDEMSGFEDWIPEKPGIYYWRIKATYYTEGGPAQKGVECVSFYRSINVKLPPPKLLSPSDNSQKRHRSTVTFSVSSVKGAEFYQYQLAWNSSFSDVVYEDNSSSSSLSIRMPTIDKEPYARLLFWRVRAVANGIAGGWSDVGRIKVVNNPPLPYLVSVGSTNEGDNACVSDNFTVTFYAHDQDGDNITSYKVRIIRKITGSTIDEYTVNKTLEDSKITFIELPIKKDYGYGDIIVRVIPVDQWGSNLDNTYGSKDFGLSDQDEEEYFYHYWRNDVVNVVNCLPPEVTNISFSPEGVIVPNQNVYLYVNKPVADPDGDPIAMYQFYVKSPDGRERIFNVYYNTGDKYVFFKYQPALEGDYVWKVRAISKVNVYTFQYGMWSKPKSFHVSPPPPVENVYPTNGAIIIGDGVIVLGAKPSDNVSAAVRAIQFETSGDKEFTETKYLSAWINTHDERGIYTCSVDGGDNGTVTYWRARASYEVAPGEWGEVYCFTKIDEMPNAIFEPSNDVFLGTNGSFELQFDATYPVITNCLGDKGTFDYKICTDFSCSEVVKTGTFHPGVKFSVDLDPGTYYFSGRQYVGGVSTGWSEPVEFYLKSEEPYSEGLLAYWNFDNCSADDESSNGNNGQIEKDLECSYDAAKGRSFKYDPSSGGYISVSSGNLVVSKFTLTAWINPDNVTGKHFVAGNSVYWLEIDNGRLVGSLYLNNTYYNVVSSVGMPENLWSFVVLEYDGSYLKIYLNSKLTGYKAVSGTLRIPPSFYIGAQNIDNTVLSLFSGYIDEVRLYDRPIDTDTIYDLMLYDGENMPGGLVGIRDFSVNPDSGTAPLETRFTCISEENSLYIWDFNGDGEYDNETEENSATYVYKGEGEYQPSVVVYKEGKIYNWAAKDVNVSY